MNLTPRYSAVSTINHWIAALLVTVMMVLGFMAAAAPDGPVEAYIMRTHISLGFFVFFVVMWRVMYRLVRGFPPLLEKARWQRWAAFVVHRLILVALAVQVLSGPLYLFTENAGINVFGWFTFIIPLGALEVIHEPMEFAHIYIGLYGLPALLGLHLAGSIYHIVHRHNAEGSSQDL